MSDQERTEATERRTMSAEEAVRHLVNTRRTLAGLLGSIDKALDVLSDEERARHGLQRKGERARIAR